MSMKYIRDTYGVPAKRGGRVVYYGLHTPIEGTILSAKRDSLHILLDGSEHPGWFHPTWRLEYL